MPKALPADERARYRQGWIAVIKAVQKSYRMTDADLGRKVGVGRDTVCRWKMDDDGNGTIPSGPARRSLEELAKARGLLESRVANRTA